MKKFLMNLMVLSGFWSISSAAMERYPDGTGQLWHSLSDGFTKGTAAVKSGASKAGDGLVKAARWVWQPNGVFTQGAEEIRQTFGVAAKNLHDELVRAKEVVAKYPTAEAQQRKNSDKQCIEQILEFSKLLNSTAAEQLPVRLDALRETQEEAARFAQRRLLERRPVCALMRYDVIKTMDKNLKNIAESHDQTAKNESLRVLTHMLTTAKVDELIRALDWFKDRLEHAQMLVSQQEKDKMQQELNKLQRDAEEARLEAERVRNAVVGQMRPGLHQQNQQQNQIRNYQQTLAPVRRQNNNEYRDQPARRQNPTWRPGQPLILTPSDSLSLLQPSYVNSYWLDARRNGLIDGWTQVRNRLVESSMRLDHPQGIESLLLPTEQAVVRIKTLVEKINTALQQAENHRLHPNDQNIQPPSAYDKNLMALWYAKMAGVESLAVDLNDTQQGELRNALATIKNRLTTTNDNNQQVHNQRDAHSLSLPLNNFGDRNEARMAYYLLRLALPGHLQQQPWNGNFATIPNSLALRASQLLKVRSKMVAFQNFVITFEQHRQYQGGNVDFTPYGIQQLRVLFPEASDNDCTDIIDDLADVRYRNNCKTAAAELLKRAQDVLLKGHCSLGEWFKDSGRRDNQGNLIPFSSEEKRLFEALCTEVRFARLDNQPGVNNQLVSHEQQERLANERYRVLNDEIRTQQALARAGTMQPQSTSETLSGIAASGAMMFIGAASTVCGYLLDKRYLAERPFLSNALMVLQMRYSGTVSNALLRYVDYVPPQNWATSPLVVLTYLASYALTGVELGRQMHALKSSEGIWKLWAYATTVAMAPKFAWTMGKMVKHGIWDCGLEPARLRESLHRAVSIAA